MYTSRISRLGGGIKPQLLKKKSTLVSSTHNYSSSLTEKTIEEKYKEKLLLKAKEQGFATIEDLKKNLQDQISEQKKKFNKIDPLKDLQEYQDKMSKNFSKDKTISKGPIDSSLEQKPFKTLDSYLQLDKIKQLSKQEIEFLWRARFANKDNTLHAVIPQGIFKPMYKNARENPAFVLPLPRELDSSSSSTSTSSPSPSSSSTSSSSTSTTSTTQKESSQGMELHYVQWNFVGPTTVHCMITSLAEFKLHKEYARPHITMSYYTDLLNEDKDIVLMNGIVEPNCNVSMQDAQLLLLNLQRFYGCMGETKGMAGKRVQLLRDFTKGGEGFNVELLIELAQSLEN